MDHEYLQALSDHVRALPDAPYLLGINMLQAGKHRAKLNLRVDFSNGMHHSVRVPAGVSARELSKVLRGLVTALDEDPRLSK